jgi:hypothetical protein
MGRAAIRRHISLDDIEAAQRRERARFRQA